MCVCIIYYTKQITHRFCICRPDQAQILSKTSFTITIVSTIIEIKVYNDNYNINNIIKSRSCRYSSHTYTTIYNI